MTRPRGMSQAEFERRFAIMVESRQATQPARQKKKQVVDEDPNYESMDLATFSNHVNDSMSDCTELAINEFVNMGRAHRKGQSLKAASHGAKGLVGTGLLAYGVIELFRAALGQQD